MKLIFLPLVLALASCMEGEDSAIPIASGRYDFVIRDPEFPDISRDPVVVTIDGSRITVQNEKPGRFPAGLIDEGTLMWNTKIERWIIGQDASDRYSEEVGGCSGGPLEVDVEAREIWLC